MDEIRALWAENIRFQRELRCWTKSELAEKVEVTHSTVSLWESNQRSPKDAHKRALAALFNVPVRTMFPLIDQSPAEQVA